MTRGEFNQLISYLQKQDWNVYGPLVIKEKSSISGPIEQGGHIAVDLIKNPEDIILDEQLPFFSFKRLFVPEKEILFEYKKNKLNPIIESTRVAVVGINLLDMKSIPLYDQVFEKDPYYIARRENILIIGHSLTPPIDDNKFEKKYEEDILEHLSFDIFLADKTFGEVEPKISDEFKVFTGSEQGRKILDDIDYADYTHIQFAGLVSPKPSEDGPVLNGGDKRMLEICDKMKNHFNAEIWNKLGEICLECGKCTIICPTCFCFRIDDQPSLEKNEGARQKCWDSCFYREFSEIAGGHKFLNSTAKRIHFWYYHKFVRVPEEYGIMGCIGCGRCRNVCPARIDIKKVLKEVLETEF